MGRKPSRAFLEAGKAWRAHLDEYRKAHPNMSLKQQMKGAKKTYKKNKGKTSLRNSRYSIHIREKKNSKKANKKKTRKKPRSKKKKSLLSRFF
tara:strand:- start:180 stop:458 length:279 start_codon:yes stop_codon:yes gene_type:complete